MKVLFSSMFMFISISIVAQTGNVGIGTTLAPQQKLEVNGKIKIGNDNAADVAGSIRYNTTTKDFEGFTGSGWVSLTKTGIHNVGLGSAGPLDSVRSSFSNDTSSNKQFGAAVAIDSVYAVIGAIGEKINSILNRGSAYIFKKQANGSWVQEAKLLPDATDAIGSFGWDVAISGDYVLVSDYMDNPTFSGDTSQVYIFKRTGTTWLKEAKISETAAEFNTLDGSAFGNSIAISGIYAVIGAKRNSLNRGSAFVYKRTGTAWARDTSLFHNITNVGAIINFGTSVSINADYIAVGSPNEIDESGAPFFTPLNHSGRVYVYKLTGTQWVFQKKILPITFGGNTFNPQLTGFGSNVSIYADKIIVYANLDHALYFYERTGTDWLDEKRLSFWAANSVSLYGNLAVVTGNAISGEPIKNYVYKYLNKQDSWNLLAYYQDPDFGVPAISDIYKNEIIIGIPAFVKSVGVKTVKVGKISFVNVQ
jgi:hypothetical protein